MKEFGTILQLIRDAQSRALQSANFYLLQVYWQLGGFVHLQLQNGSWGDKIVDNLAAWLREQDPSLKGFDRRSIYRMRAFYEAWQLSETEIQNSQLVDNELFEIESTLSPQSPDNASQFVVTLSPQIGAMPAALSRLSWSHHIELLGKTASAGERVYYLLLAIRNNYTVRQLRRQIETSLFERQMLSPKSLLHEHPAKEKISNIFRNTYITEFLNLPEPYTERELERELVARMKDFILELGNDFLFIGEEYKLQVGMHDYFTDLLFYHRELNCLVVFELKIEEFKPEHLGKLNFYLEALDRDVKKPHENPSIGVLLCKNKDKEVVEYALSRNMSPALVAEYKTKLPDKKLLQQKMHELLRESNYEGT